MIVVVIDRNNNRIKLFNEDEDRDFALISKYDQPENDVKGKN